MVNRKVRKQQECNRIEMPLVVRADTANDDDRTLEVVVATEDPCLGIDRQYNLCDQILLIRKENMPETVSFIDSHNKWSVERVYGSIRDFRIEQENGRNILVGRMAFADTQRGKDLYVLYRDGHLTDVSISAAATAKVYRVQPGQTSTIKGQKFTAGERPLDVFVRWEAREVSAVVRGADQSAKVRREEGERDMNFEQWCERKGYDLEAASEAQRSAWHKEFLGEEEKTLRAEVEAKVRKELEDAAGDDANRSAADADGAVDPAAIDVAVERALKARREAEEASRKEIETICGEDHKEIARQAITEGWDVARTSQAVLKAVRTAQDSGIGAPAFHGGAELDRTTLADAILMRGAVVTGDDIVKEDSTNGAQRAEMADKVRSMAMVDICRQALLLDGKAVPHNRDDLMRAAFTTISLPQIFSNVANKSVMRGYLYAKRTWDKWCSVGSEPNFKTATKVRLTDMGDLEEVNNAGEIADGTLAEEYEQYSLARYAKKQTITDQNIIDDDLSVLTRVPQMMGAKAGMLISKLVYEHLLANGNMSDGTALFHADHANLITGATTALSKGGAALRKGLEKFRKQTDKDGQPIDVEPSVLLCSPEDEEYARALLRSITLAEGTTAGVATANIWGSMGIMPVVESRLSNTNYTGYSTTAWYLMGDKNVVDTIQVAFLDGKQQPTVQFFNQQQMGIDTIGVGYRVILDAVAKALDWRGMVKVAGA